MHQTRIRLEYFGLQLLIEAGLCVQDRRKARQPESNGALSRRLQDRNGALHPWGCRHRAGGRVGVSIIHCFIAANLLIAANEHARPDEGPGARRRAGLPGALHRMGAP